VLIVLFAWQRYVYIGLGYEQCNFVKQKLWLIF